jgi:hypothetical protein
VAEEDEALQLPDRTPVLPGPARPGAPASLASRPILV